MPRSQAEGLVGVPLAVADQREKLAGIGQVFLLRFEQRRRRGPWVDQCGGTGDANNGMPNSQPRA